MSCKVKYGSHDWFTLSKIWPAMFGWAVALLAVISQAASGRPTESLKLFLFPPILETQVDVRSKTVN